MTVDRFSICDDNTTDGAESENNIASTNPSFISFVDPRENIPQEYELHKRSLLPKAISKCQGKCGKPITHSDILIVKSYGKTTWTEKNTGKDRCKYGPSYIHFLDNCLKNFDTDHFYAPGELFCFDRIKISSQTRDSHLARKGVFIKPWDFVK